jgi:hypothetical protein
MLRLPSRFAASILSFAPLIFQRGWDQAEVLLIGATLVPGPPARPGRWPAGSFCATPAPSRSADPARAASAGPPADDGRLASIREAAPGISREKSR